jgi:hypothetical protein
MTPGMRHGAPRFAVLFGTGLGMDLCSFSAKARAQVAVNSDESVSKSFIQLSRCRNTHRLSVAYLFVRDVPSPQARQRLSGLPDRRRDVMVQKPTYGWFRSSPLLVAVSPLTEDDVTQMSTIDSSCDGSDLSLMESYGALNFTGYSCDKSDVHNC